MSYCRRGKYSDVYVLADKHPVTGAPGWRCDCEKSGNFAHNRQGMIEHLHQHRDVGDKVPEHVIERLVQEIAAG